MTTQPTFTVERPTVLFDEPYATDPAVPGGTPNYDVSLDGQRFLMVKSTGAGESPTVTLVQNWVPGAEAARPHRQMRKMSAARCLFSRQIQITISIRRNNRMEIGINITRVRCHRVQWRSHAPTDTSIQTPLAA